jgi:hypothetical protein
MRWIILILVFAACASTDSKESPVASEPLDGVEVCEQYAALSDADAREQFRDYLLSVKSLGPEFTAMQAEGVPDEDPFKLQVAQDLGRAMGGSYGICVCNEFVGESDECSWIVDSMESRFGS